MSNEISKDFVSTESREFRFKIGHLVASSLSGFIAGVLLASMMWAVVVLTLFE